MTLREWIESRSISRSDLIATLRVSSRTVDGWLKREFSPRLEEAIKVHELTKGLVSYAELTAIPYKLRRGRTSDQAAQ